MVVRLPEKQNVVHIPTKDKPQPPEMLKNHFAESMGPKWTALKTEWEGEHLNRLFATFHSNPPLSLGVQPQVKEPIFEVQYHPQLQWG